MIQNINSDTLSTGEKVTKMQTYILGPIENVISTLWFEKNILSLTIFETVAQE